MKNQFKLTKVCYYFFLIIENIEMNLIVTKNVSARYPIVRNVANVKNNNSIVFEGEGISDYNPVSIAKSKLKGVKMAIFGQDDYSAPIKKVLELHGNRKIKSMVVVRSPVEEVLISLMNGVSVGGFGKNMENSDFDKLYHLQVDITLDNRVVVRTEKVEVVALEVGVTQKAKQEEKEVVDNIPDITLTELMNNTRKRMGKNFFPYSAKNNNCQDYILNLFLASNIGSEEDYNFIKQDTKQLFNKLDGLRKVSNSLTGIGAKVNLLMNGGSVRGKTQRIIF